jgi:hypothetical protein
MTALQQQRRWDQIDSSTHTAATATGTSSTGNNGSSGNGYSNASRQQQQRQQHLGSNANIVTVSAADVIRQGGSYGKDLEHLLQLVAMCIAGYTSYAAAAAAAAATAGSGSNSTEQQHGGEQVSYLMTHDIIVNSNSNCVSVLSVMYTYFMASHNALLDNTAVHRKAQCLMTLL